MRQSAASCPADNVSPERVRGGADDRDGLEVERRSFGRPSREEPDMASAVSAHSVRQRLGQADVLARAVELDMTVATGWRPTVDNYLGRVTKPRILEAVREAKGEQSVQLIDHLKKCDMDRGAERLLDGPGWLPEPLRFVEVDATGNDTKGEAEALPEFLATAEDEVTADADEEQPHIIAAE